MPHRCFGLGVTLGRAGQGQPVALNSTSLSERQQSPASSDFNVIRMSRNANDLDGALRKAQMLHCSIKLNAMEPE
jgi:hypothetical protein